MLDAKIQSGLNSPPCLGEILRAREAGWGRSCRLRVPEGSRWAQLQLPCFGVPLTPNPPGGARAGLGAGPWVVFVLTQSWSCRASDSSREGSHPARAPSPALITWRGWAHLGEAVAVPSSHRDSPIPAPVWGWMGFRAPESGAWPRFHFGGAQCTLGCTLRVLGHRGSTLGGCRFWGAALPQPLRGVSGIWVCFNLSGAGVFPISPWERG